MEIIVEIVNRAHKTIERQKFDRPIRIGRAFDNDFILTDTHISPHHAVIKEDEAGKWYVQDLNSKNGIFTKRHRKVDGLLYLESGDEFVVGKVHLRVFAVNHPVSDTIGLSAWENFIYVISHPFYFILILLASLLFFSGVEYMDNFNKFAAKEFFLEAAVVPLLAFVWAGVWAFVGRILRHETRFMAQCIVALVYLVAVTITAELLDVLAFNVPDRTMVLIVKNVSQGILLFLLFSFNLRLASLKSPINRMITANIAAWSLVSVTLFVSEVNAPDFSPYPKYVANILPPSFLFAKKVSAEQFLLNSEFIFKEAQ